MRYQLKIDIDGKLHEKKLTERLMLLRRIFQMKDIKIEKAKTKHGWHIRIFFDSNKNIDSKDIVFGQLICMSDWRRECFNFLRCHSNQKYWNVLFKFKTDSDGKVLSNEV